MGARAEEMIDDGEAEKGDRNMGSMVAGLGADGIC